MAAVADKQAIIDVKDRQIARLIEELKRATDLTEWEKRRRIQVEGDLEIWREEGRALRVARATRRGGGFRTAKRRAAGCKKTARRIRGRDARSFVYALRIVSAEAARSL